MDADKPKNSFKRFKKVTAFSVSLTRVLRHLFHSYFIMLAYGLTGSDTPAHLFDHVHRAAKECGRADVTVEKIEL